jgi:hypothetical protein
MEKCWALVKKSLEKARDAQKEFADRDRNAKKHELKVKDMVLMRAEQHVHKFSPKYKGPFIIEKIKGSIIELREPNSNKIFPVHADKLKKFAMVHPNLEREENILALEWDNSPISDDWDPNFDHKIPVENMEWNDFAKQNASDQKKGMETFKILRMNDLDYLVYISDKFMDNYRAVVDNGSSKESGKEEVTDGNLNLGPIRGKEKAWVVDSNNKRVNLEFKLVDRFSPYGLPASTGWSETIIGQNGIKALGLDQ